jgi:magnesium chelatase family protein
MYGRVFGVAVIGVHGHVVRVEAHVGRGLPALTLAGLPGTGVLDGRERVRPAVESAGLEWPLRRVVVNLSPANIRKEGPGFDLPIAMGVLAASAQVPASRLGGYAFSGELSLKGELMSTPGILSVAIAAREAGLAGGGPYGQRGGGRPRRGARGGGGLDPFPGRRVRQGNVGTPGASAGPGSGAGCGT